MAPRRTSKRRSSKRRSSRKNCGCGPARVRPNYTPPSRGFEMEPRPGDYDEETGELTTRGKIREEMIKKLAAEWNEVHGRMERESFRSEEDREAEYEALSDRAHEAATRRLEEMQDDGDIPPGREDEIYSKLVDAEMKKLRAEVEGDDAAERLSVIEELLGELGGRMMRPYEHWNEEEAYREYAERDRGDDY